MRLTDGKFGALRKRRLHSTPKHSKRSFAKQHSEDAVILRLVGLQ